MPSLWIAARDATVLLVELIALFLLVSIAVTIATRRIGVHRLRDLLGGRPVGGAIKGIALGFATPFCTYSAIPVLTAMRGAGVRTATWVGFLLAAPVLDPLIAVAIIVIFGLRAAAAYVVATFIGILVAALLADATDLDGPSDAGPVVAHGVGGGASAPWRGVRGEIGDAAVAAVDLVRDMARPLLVAVALAVAIAGFVPRSALTAVTGPDNPLAVPLAALLGAPFYVSGEAFMPIAAALLDRGASQGAVFALIISAAGVNLPELMILRRLLARRTLVALVASILAIAIFAGLTVPAVGSTPSATPGITAWS